MNVSPMSPDREVILVVGDIDAWHNQGRHLPLDPGLRYCSFDDLDEELLSWVRPCYVVVPLVSSGFDAVDVAQRLAELGFRKRFRAISKPLPNVDMVQNELQRAVPGLDCAIIQVSDPNLTEEV